MIALAGEMQGSCKTPLGYVWRERSGGDRREMIEQLLDRLVEALRCSKWSGK